MPRAETIPEKLKFAERVCLIAATTVAALLFAEYLVRAYIEVSVPAKITLTLFMVSGYYAAAFLNHRRTGNARLLRVAQILLFALFVAFLLDVTLLGFSVDRVHYSGSREEYRYWFCNFTPFATIENYIRGYQKGYFAFRYMILNLLGNLLLYVPFALFLPLLFRHERRWFFYIPTVLLAALAAEALQFLFMVGSCDVDDFLLNVLGAVSFFFLLKIPPLRRFVRWITASDF